MTQTELVIIPASGVGHLVPAVELAKRIVSSSHNISIHFFIYSMTNESSQTQTYFNYFSRQIDLDRITFITLPRVSDPPDSSSPLFYPTMIQLHKPLVKEAILDRGLVPAAIVVDLVNIPMADVADELNIPFYVFFTSGPCYLNLIFQFAAMSDEIGYDAVTKLVNDPDAELDFPGFQSRVPAKVLPGVLLDKESYMPMAMIHVARRFRQAKGIIVNSFMELEPFTIKAMHDDDKIPTVYPVGPILNLYEHGDTKLSNNSSDEEAVIMRWLDEQPSASVVFICSGSSGCYEVDQVKEIAKGLDRSGYPFLWALRLVTRCGGSDGVIPTEHEMFVEALPEGFMDRTAHKGKIVSWAPQIKVLAHHAVGGFMSHCGWNSITESIWFGVPIATWPLHSDQQINAFTLVKELGLAAEIRLDYRWDFKKQKGNFLVVADEVENGVKRLMTVSTNDEIKVKLREMSRLTREVVQQGGSSYKWLAHLIEEITQNVN